MMVYWSEAKQYVVMEQLRGILRDLCDGLFPPVRSPYTHGREKQEQDKLREELEGKLTSVLMAMPVSEDDDKLSFGISQGCGACLPVAGDKSEDSARERAAGIASNTRYKLRLYIEEGRCPPVEELESQIATLLMYEANWGSVRCDAWREWLRRSSLVRTKELQAQDEHVAAYERLNALALSQLTADKSDGTLAKSERGEESRAALVSENKEREQMDSKSVLAEAKLEMSEASVRLGATQATRFARDIVAAAMVRHFAGDEKGENLVAARKMVAEFLASPLGDAVVRMALGFAVEAIPNDKAKVLARELRVSAMERGGNEAVEFVAKPLREFLSGLASGESSGFAALMAGDFSSITGPRVEVPAETSAPAADELAEHKASLANGKAQAVK